MLASSVTNNKVVSDRQWITENVTSIQHRDYQVATWLKLWQCRSEKRKRALVHLATGLGKTSVAAVDVKHYLEVENPGAKVLFVSHMNDISRQARSTFLFVNPSLKTAIYDGKIVKLLIPKEAKRSHAFGRKCRAEYAEVLEITKGNRQLKTAVSTYDESLKYEVGKTVRPIQPFSDNWVEECDPGIHFFITKLEAENYA